MSLAPKESIQFGSAFQRFLRKIFQAEPKWGPVNLIKGDITDGFYQGCLRAQGLVRLGLVVTLDNQDSEPLISFTLADTMRWV